MLASRYPTKIVVARAEHKRALVKLEVAGESGKDLVVQPSILRLEFDELERLPIYGPL